MRALSVTQPWGGLIAAKLKPIENRVRPMIKREDFGKPFAIHATKEIDEDVYERIAEIAPDIWTVELQPDGRAPDVSQPWYRLTRITSAVIAVATIDRVIAAIGWDEEAGRYIYDPADLVGLDDTARRWLFGRVGYVLRDVVALATPVPCRGWQGFWNLPAAVERLVVEQLGERAA